MAYKKEYRKFEKEETRKFSGKLKPLMTEEQKAAG